MALAVASVTGCMSGPLRAYREGSLDAGSLLLDVPLIRQDAGRACGFAAVSMLCEYYGMPIAEDDLELVRVETEAKKGVSGRLLEQVLERNGFHVRIFAGELLDEEGPRGVAYHLKKGRPVLVMVSPDGKNYHYTVVSGLSVERDLVVLEDPDRGKVVCRGRVFRKIWERGNRFTLLAVPVDVGVGAGDGSGPG